MSDTDVESPATAGTLRPAPHGGYFPQRDDGTVVNPARLEHVPEPVRPLLERVVAVYRRRLAGRLHSVYVRGSVVHGTAVRLLSDLDTFALVLPSVHEPYCWWCTPAWSDEEAAGVLATGEEWLCGIDYGYASWHEDFLQRNPSLAMTIATQSLCLWGEDVSSRLPRYRPGASMCSEHLGLQRDLARLDEMLSAERPLDTALVRAAVKRMIRTAFELVMEREGRYTTSLYHAWESFAKHHPEQAPEVYDLLEFYLAPVQDRARIERYVRDIGAWLLRRAQAQLVEGPLP